MRRSAAAFIVPLAAGEEPRVEVIDDIDACTQMYSDPPVIEMLEEEFCFLSPDGTHTYRNSDNYCACCGMASPWVRRDACRS